MSDNNTQKETTDPKQTLDYIFIINLICAQEIQDIGSRETAGSQMFITGAWSQLLMNISWLQRLYSKAGLDDSPEVELDMPEIADRAGGIELIISYLDLCLDKLESEKWSAPKEVEKVPLWIADTIIQNIYSGIYETQVLLEYELTEINNQLNNSYDQTNK